MQFTIAACDRWLIVLEKPAGLLAVQGRGPDKQDCLAARVQAEFSDALVVHRLDRDTSGLMVMARGIESQRALARQFEERTVQKRYVAVVAGCITASSGRIELPLTKDFAHPPRRHVDHAHGQPAITDWRVVERFDDRTRLELAPLSGRSHQLRVHLAAIGHPILGDPLYAPPEIQALADRLLLHASRLTLTHPATGEQVSWQSLCPF